MSHHEATRKAEDRLLAIPPKHLGPAVRGLVRDIVRDRPAPEAVPADPVLRGLLEEAEHEQTELRAEVPGLRAERATIEDQISRLQARLHYVEERLRQIEESESAHQEEVGQIEAAGRKIMANGRLADLRELQAGL